MRLPIRKVVLYKHGVGYFERQGEVEGDVTVELELRHAEMNDVLKSLTVLDLGDGLVTSVSYESTDPIEKQLSDIAITIPEQSSLTGFLAQVKGAAATVEVGGSTVDGLIMGTESIAREVNGQTQWTHLVCLLVDGASLRYFDLLEVRRITFADPSLQKDLKHLLETLINSKKKNLKRLTIYARGESRRELIAAYVVEAPVWKTSYRVLLPAPESPDEPMIQGWALVDNTQDEDWDDVSLTLVAGLPVSFVHDLYSPRYAKRPVVEVRAEEAYAPPELEEALYEDDAEAERALPPRAMAGPGRLPRLAKAAAMPPVPAAPAPAPARAMAHVEARTRSVPVQTRTAEVGDLFQYEIANAVTVKRNQSALVPILQRPFEGRRVAVYNRDVREKNPLSAVLLKNTTGMTLEGGAVTVFEGESYVGESMLETLKPDEERLLPYSVELGVVVSIDHETRVDDVHFVRVVRGALHLFRYRLKKTIYKVRSKLDRAVDLFLDHPFQKQWKLVDTPRPVETTETFQRFRFEVPAKTTTPFVVTERGEESETFWLRNMSRDDVALWMQRRYLDDGSREALERIVEVLERRANLQSWIELRETEIQQIFENQRRMRENLDALGTSPDEKALRDRYVGELGQDEDRLQEIRAEIEGWRAEMAGVERQMNELVQGLSFERPVPGRES